MRDWSSDVCSSDLAYADLFLDFAPGAVLDNFTFEIAVDGSEGYWASEPQITLLDTQTPILDWRDYGDLGRQNSFSNNPPEVEGGLLDTWLQPNSVSDASWLLPSGVTIEDLVIEALRPADPRVSFSSLNVVIHDSAVNPHDGRLYVLLDDDMLHLDDQMHKRIIDIDYDIQGRSIALDVDGNRLLIGTEDGEVLSRRLSDSAELDNLIAIEDAVPIRSVSVDAYGTVWAATDCNLHHLTPGENSWTKVSFCSSDSMEVPTDMIIIADTIYIGTAGSGVRVIEYSTIETLPLQISIDSNTQWSTANYLTSNQITQFELLGDHLLIATIGGGVNRYNVAASSWLATWSTNNWLASNVIRGLALTADWLHILAANTIHSYDTTAMLFRSQIGRAHV